MIETVHGVWLNPRYVERVEPADSEGKVRLWTHTSACYHTNMSLSKERALIEQSNGS